MACYQIVAYYLKLALLLAIVYGDAKALASNSCQGGDWEQAGIQKYTESTAETDAAGASNLDTVFLQRDLLVHTEARLATAVHQHATSKEHPDAVLKQEVSSSSTLDQLEDLLARDIEPPLGSPAESAPAASFSPITRVGRTMLASDPAATAHFFVQRFGARVITREQDATHSKGFLTSQHECAQIVTVELPAALGSARMQLIKDTRKPALVAQDAEEILRVIYKDWSAVTFSTKSSWHDDHDGFDPPTLFNSTGMDSIPGGVDCRAPGDPYGEPPEPKDYTSLVISGVIPRTTRSFELAYSDLDWNTTKWLLANGCPGHSDPAAAGTITPQVPGSISCDRNTSIDFLYRSYGMYKGWFKATTQTFDPERAAELMVVLFGASHIQEPYTAAAKRGKQEVLNQCGIYPRWVQFHLKDLDGAPLSFMMHFVASLGSTGEAGSSLTASNFSSAVLAHRNLTQGIFDTWLYNSIVFEVEDLMPYKAKLREMSVPFLERFIPSDNAATQGTCALWVSIPGTYSAVQVIGLDGCSEADTPVFDACSSS